MAIWTRNSGAMCPSRWTSSTLRRRRRRICERGRRLGGMMTSCTWVRRLSCEWQDAWLSRRRSRFVELCSRPPHRPLFTAPRYFFDVDYTHILQHRRILGELAMLEGEGDSPCFDYSVIDALIALSTPTLFRRTIPFPFSLCSSAFHPTKGGD
jgi:hypothetical protein